MLPESFKDNIAYVRQKQPFFDVLNTNEMVFINYHKLHKLPYFITKKSCANNCHAAVYTNYNFVLFLIDYDLPIQLPLAIM